MIRKPYYHSFSMLCIKVNRGLVITAVGDNNRSVITAVRSCATVLRALTNERPADSSRVATHNHFRRFETPTRHQLLKVHFRYADRRAHSPHEYPSRRSRTQNCFFINCSPLFFFFHSLSLFVLLVLHFDCRCIVT